MKTSNLIKSFLLAATAGGIALSASAQLMFSSDFEDVSTLAAAGWVGTTGSTISDLRNHTVGGSQSARISTSADRIRRDLGAEVEAFRYTFHIFDDSGTRNYGQALSYVGAGFGDGALQQLFALGKYHTGTHSTNTYQYRFLTGTGAAWFDLPVANIRTADAWVRFDIERTTLSNDINFYVNNTLIHTVTTASFFTVDSVTIGSVAAGITATVGYIDDVSFTAIPEPSTYAAIFGGLALLGAFVYRRRLSVKK